MLRVINSIPNSPTGQISSRLRWNIKGMQSSPVQIVRLCCKICHKDVPVFELRNSLVDPLKKYAHSHSNEQLESYMQQAVI